MIIILNGTSGTAANGGDPAAMACEAFKTHGVEPEIWSAASGAELCEMAKRAAESDHDTIVAGGGDGSVNAVVSRIFGTGKRLGVLPLGTLNHFAKDLKLPLDLPTAAKVLVEGHETRVDVAEVNGYIFVNNSSLGLYPRIVRHRDAQREKLGRGKWTAFLWAMLHALKTYPSLRMKLYVDGKVYRERTSFLFVGNNNYRMDVLRIGERDRLDEGTLSIYLARGTGRWGLVKLAMRSLVSRLEQAENFETLSARELRVETHRPMVDVSTDGEVSHLESPLVYKIHPLALRVIVPSPASAS